MLNLRRSGQVKKGWANIDWNEILQKAQEQNLMSCPRLAALLILKCVQWINQNYDFLENRTRALMLNIVRSHERLFNPHVKKIDRIISAESEAIARKTVIRKRHTAAVALNDQVSVASGGSNDLLELIRALPQLTEALHLSTDMTWLQEPISMPRLQDFELPDAELSQLVPDLEEEPLVLDDVDDRFHDFTRHQLSANTTDDNRLLVSFHERAANTQDNRVIRTPAHPNKPEPPPPQDQPNNPANAATSVRRVMHEATANRDRTVPKQAPTVTRKAKPANKPGGGSRTLSDIFGTADAGGTISIALEDCCEEDYKHNRVALAWKPTITSSQPSWWDRISNIASMTFADRAQLIMQATVSNNPDLDLPRSSRESLWSFAPDVNMSNRRSVATPFSPPQNPGATSPEITGYPYPAGGTVNPFSEAHNEFAQASPPLVLGGASSAHGGEGSRGAIVCRTPAEGTGNLAEMGMSSRTAALKNVLIAVFGKKEMVELTNLLPKQAERWQVAVCFGSLLELLSTGWLETRQQYAFGPIVLHQMISAPPPTVKRGARAEENDEANKENMKRIRC